MPRERLHIGVDGRELTGRVTGVGRYLAGVLRAWAEDPGFPHRLSIFVPAPLRPTAALRGDVTWVDVPARSAGTWWEQRHLPAALRRTGVDVLFAPGYTAPLRSPCPSVVVVHDVSFHAHPEWFGWREGLRRRWLTRVSARRAGRVLTVSEFSASEIARWLGIGRHQLLLAPPAVTAVPLDVEMDARRPLVLYAGSLFNRRHPTTLIEAFAYVAAAVPESRLVLVGDNRTHPRIDPLAAAAGLGLAGRVGWDDYVSEAELSALYRSAAVFVFLSDYEGFGIPPLEAIAHGVPPVLLDTPVSREIYGDAATLVTAHPKEVGAAIVDLLTRPPLRHARLAAGQPLLERYTWTRTAATVRLALEEAAR